MSGTMKIGLLGASVCGDEWKAGGMELLSQVRLMEIERRILAIESELGNLNPGAPFGGVPFYPPDERDSGRLPQGEDSRSEAECVASQSGLPQEGIARPSFPTTKG